MVVDCPNSVATLMFNVDQETDDMWLDYCDVSTYGNPNNFLKMLLNLYKNTLKE